MQNFPVRKIIFMCSVVAGCVTAFAFGGSSEDVLSGASVPPNPWAQVKSPVASQPQSIGTYAAGCLRGAVPLAPVGPGYQTMHPSRNRLFGHPDLIQFIQTLGSAIHAKNQGDLIVGDMGQPRGGPFQFGHASHQIGLDVDLWYWQPVPGRILNDDERENLSAENYVIEDFEGLRANWNDSKMDLVKTAALSTRVQRIFVNPVIKQAACRQFPNAVWISKLRPWWGHDDHFHVRLYCAVGDLKCKPQAEVEIGSGCDASLEAWFTNASKSEAKDMRLKPAQPHNISSSKVCQRVLKE